MRQTQDSSVNVTAHIQNNLHYLPSLQQCRYGIFKHIMRMEGSADAKKF